MRLPKISSVVLVAIAALGAFLMAAPADAASIVRVEWMRGDYVYSAETIVTDGSTSVASGAAPSFAGAQGRARVTVLTGAAIVNCCSTSPTATATNGVRMETLHPPINYPVETGQKLAVIEAGDAQGTITATIANGASLSGAVDLGDTRLHRIILPASWTTAAISFQGSPDGVTYNDLFNESGEYSLAATTVAAASRSIVVDQAMFYGIRYLKIRSGLTAAAVTQGGARVLTLVTVPR